MGVPLHDKCMTTLRQVKDSKRELTLIGFYVNFSKKISYLGRPCGASGEDGENPSRPGRCEWGFFS